MHSSAAKSTRWPRCGHVYDIGCWWTRSGSLFLVALTRAALDISKGSSASFELAGVLTASQHGDVLVVLGEDGFGVWVLMLDVQACCGGGLVLGQPVVSLTACGAEDSLTMPVLVA